MRYFESTLIQISEDTLNEPKAIRFSEETEETDVISLLRVITNGLEKFPASATTAISFGSLTTVSWVFVKAAAPCSLIINGSTAIPLVPGKGTKMWCQPTSLSIVVPGTAPVDVTVALAGT